MEAWCDGLSGGAVKPAVRRHAVLAHGVAYSLLSMCNQRCWSPTICAAGAVVYGRTNSRLAVDLFESLTAAPSYKTMLDHVNKWAGGVPLVGTLMEAMVLFDNINRRLHAKSRTGLSADSSTAKVADDAAVMMTATVIARMLIAASANGGVATNVLQLRDLLSPARVGLKNLYDIEQDVMHMTYDAYHGSDESVDGTLSDKVVHQLQRAREVVHANDVERWRMQFQSMTATSSSNRWLPNVPAMVDAMVDDFVGDGTAKAKFDQSFASADDLLSKAGNGVGALLTKEEKRLRKRHIIPHLKKRDGESGPTRALFSLVTAIEGNPSAEVVVLEVLYDEMMRLKQQQRKWGMVTCDNAISKLWWNMVGRVVEGGETSPRVREVVDFFYMFTGGLHEEQVLIDMLLTATYDLFGGHVARALLWVKGGGIDSLLNGATIRVKRNRLHVLCVAFEHELMRLFVDDLVDEEVVKLTDKQKLEERFSRWMQQQTCESFTVVTDLVDGMRSALLLHEATRTGDFDLMLGARFQLLEYLLASKHARYAEVVSRELYMIMKLRELRPEVFELYARFASVSCSRVDSDINGMSGDECMETFGVRVARDNAGEMRSADAVHRATVLGRFFNGPQGASEFRSQLLCDLGVDAKYRDREGSTKDIARDVLMAQAALRAGGLDRLLHVKKRCKEFKCGEGLPKPLIGLGNVPLRWELGSGPALSEKCAESVDKWINHIATSSADKKIANKKKGANNIVEEKPITDWLSMFRAAKKK